MHLHSYRLNNYRRLRDAHVELAPDISIFVGANNSGKTSATEAVAMFLAGSKNRFSIFDFNSSSWKKFNEIGEATPDTFPKASVPTVSLDLWFHVEADDLYLVIPLLPSSKWSGSKVGIRIELSPRNTPELLNRYQEKRDEANARANALPGGAGSYIPWPKSLTDYLDKELHSEFELHYFVLDISKFDEKFCSEDGYIPKPLAGETNGAALLKSLIRVDCLNAQRHLADPSTSGGVGSRAEDLSKRLSRFYQRNLEKREEDHSALKALFESEVGLNQHLMDVFQPTLERLAKLGYPGLNNPHLEIKSALNPATIMSQDAKIHYIVGNNENAVRLPDSYNGLGFKNLIYMVVEILDLQARWQDDDSRAPLHLIFIEEPEAHLHAQLQQVFVRNILDLLITDSDKGSIFTSQVVVTTHSPHIIYERGFDPIRYFRRHIADGEQSTQVVNLSSFQTEENPKDKHFLQRYLKLTHCDLFFADAVILVEGNVERLLLPLMIEKKAKTLRSAALSILEVGGAFGHRFKALIEFLGITTLIITDIDSVTSTATATQRADDEEEEDIEFEIPSEEPDQPMVKRYGKACLPSEPDSVTSNQTLIQWLPKVKTIAALLAAVPESKEEALKNSEPSKIRVAYQTCTKVTWANETTHLCGRTLEEAFGLENSIWCQAPEQRNLGLKLRSEPATAAQLAAGLHKRVTSKSFDKTKFALQVLSSNKESWKVPTYISEGLIWLNKQVNIETEQEIEAAMEAKAALEIIGEVNE